MQARRTLTPGQKGTKKLLERYGSALVYVRYRYDERQCRRFTTVELIIEEAPWLPSARVPANAIVGVEVGLKEVELQRRVKQAGGKWNPKRRVWELRYDQAMTLGLEGRIKRQAMSNSRHPEVSNTGNPEVASIRH